MRILHTADWHLGCTLGQNHASRTQEHAAFLQWLLATIQEQGVEVLLVAGDIFDQAQPSAEAQQLYYDFLGQAARLPGLRRVVITGGNHDSATRLDAPDGPVALTAERSTPSSRANLRTEGDACGLTISASSPGSGNTGGVLSAVLGADTDAGAGAEAAAVTDAGEGAWAEAASEVEATVEAEDAAVDEPVEAAGDSTATLGTAGAASLVTAASPAIGSTSAITLPSFTLSPSLTLSSTTRPALPAGISMEAFSDSTVTRLCSSCTRLPG